MLLAFLAYMMCLSVVVACAYRQKGNFRLVMCKVIKFSDHQPQMIWTIKHNWLETLERNSLILIICSKLESVDWFSSLFLSLTITILSRLCFFIIICLIWHHCKQQTFLLLNCWGWSGNVQTKLYNILILSHPQF